MNLFPYVLAIALSCVGVALLSLAFILNLMQLDVQPSSEMMPCLDDAGCHCFDFYGIFLFWGCFPQISVASEYVKIVYVHYFIPFKLYC